MNGGVSPRVLLWLNLIALGSLAFCSILVKPVFADFYFNVEKAVPAVSAFVLRISWSVEIMFCLGVAAVFSVCHYFFPVGKIKIRVEICLLLGLIVLDLLYLASLLLPILFMRPG
jgi:hypothetical protein